jgi:DNA-binding ferritin-like protein
MTPLHQVHAALIAQNSLFWNYHWQSKDYGEHLLFKRLYEARESEIDRLAELITAVHGGINPVESWGAALKLIEVVEASGGSSRNKSAQIIRAVLSRIQTADNSFPNGPYKLGVNNVIAGISDSQLEALYLVQQGIKP